MRSKYWLTLMALAAGACTTPGATTTLPSATSPASPVAVASADPTPTARPTPSARPTAMPQPSPTATPAPLCPAVDESAFDATQIVLATANIFGAGHEIGPAPGGGGRGTLPPVWPIPPGTSSVVISCALGEVIPIRDAQVANGPDGDHLGATDVESFEGIAGIVHDSNGMFLTGVFLTDAEPADPAPERLDFSADPDFETLAPQIAQTFFIGDGVDRRFLVPDGATRLFLGFADAALYVGLPGWYGNNVGYLDVTVALGD